MKEGGDKERNTQFSVKWCISCNYAWEKDTKNVLMHLDFPSYGLQRKTCPHCIKKEQRMEDFSYAQVYSN